MDYVYIGKIVNTHGIKGEVRILSDFLKKEIIFKKSFNLYLGPNYQKEVINTYRVHKNYDMVSFIGINDINEVLKYKGSKVYINRDDLNLNKEEYLIEDLINFSIICNNANYGIVKDIVTNKVSILLLVEHNNKTYYIPYIDEFINNVDLKNKNIVVERVKELYEI